MMKYSVVALVVVLAAVSADFDDGFFTGDHDGFVGGASYVSGGHFGGHGAYPIVKGAGRCWKHKGGHGKGGMMIQEYPTVYSTGGQYGGSQLYGGGQYAGSQVYGGGQYAGSQIYGGGQYGGSQMYGAGSQMYGAGSQMYGAGSQMYGAGQYAGSQMYGAGLGQYNGGQQLYGGGQQFSAGQTVY
ncbi:glycine-rich cell wall structural protein 1.8-like [Mizuhopecten yessoensis]|nr:glycine-rich cell wall structural protein 1.8-like [Mizuhopecten yessoensis]